jgi:ADP-ribose pyrophosphatase YjhB (NUDIX family)
VRELEEEIGVKALAFEEMAVLGEPQQAKHGEARYHIYKVTDWRGEPRLLGNERSELRWLGLDDALALPLAHASYGDLFSKALGHGRADNRDSQQRSVRSTGA